MKVLREWFMFLAISLVVFWLAFGDVGRWLSDCWTGCFDWIILSGVFGALLTVAVTLLGLLPQILILFSYFYFLEHSRIKFPSHVVMGFGCTTVAISAIDINSTKPNNYFRKRTAILLPFVPCSAKAPVVLLLLGGVLRLNFFIIFLLYVFCVLIGIIISRLFVHQKVERTIKKTEIFLHSGYISFSQFSKKPIVNKKYKTASISILDMLHTVLINTVQFFKRISGTVLVAATILYFLSSYTFHLKVAQNFNQSILFWVCDLISPIFVPLGFGQPAVIAALAFGFLGKELVAASIISLSPASLLLSTVAPFGFTMASVIAFVVFFMLYPPCISAIRATAMQVGRKTAVLSTVLSFAIAYACAFGIYTLMILVA